MAGLSLRLGLGLSSPSKGAGAPVFPPVNTVAPVISGTATEGQTQTATQGTWSPAGDTYAYQWRRDGANISGATSTTYVLVTADVGALIACTVTATNADGSASATSNSLGPVAAAPTGPTYADFVASITAKATNGSLGPNALPSGGGGASAGKYIVTFAGAPTDTLMGSSWSSFFGGGQSRWGTVARHAYPSQAPFTENTTNNRVVYLDVAYPGEADTYTALDRNGFLSGGSTSNPRSSYTIVQFAWWDAALGKALQSNPSVGGAPTDYAY